MQHPLFRPVLILFLLISTAAMAQQSTASQQVSTFEINAPQLNTLKKIWVYLPKNYNSERKKYPVLYMHDAQNVFDKKTSFSGEWGVDEALDSVAAQVIVIAIEHGNEKRIDELTPFPHPKHGGGNADAYVDFIVKTLKPEIEKKYRTKTNAKNTAIMGSSLGGLVSFYAALEHPDVFGKAGVFSPSFWFSDKIFELADSKKKIKTKMYFLAGDNESDDMVPDLDKMYNLLDQKRCECRHLSKKQIVKGGQHNEKLWRDHFLNAYLWLF